MQYVRANKNMEQEQEAKGKYDSRSRLRTTVSSRNESEDCNRSSVTDDSSASYNQTTTNNGVNSSYKLNSTSTEKIVISTTGDPAHDMLDLFLGPLLKKPVEEKKNNFMLGDVAISQEVGKFGIESKKNIAREEIVPLMKKKSSLKDKVAMFLD